jgi:preprotein translocase subunit SecF
MLFGVVLVGTYTSIFIAAPLLIYFGVGYGREASGEVAPATFEAEAFAPKKSAPTRR